MILQLPEVVIDPKMRGMCRLPYPNHPKGCPNFNHKEGCPPSCPTFADAYDLARPVFAVINEFDYAAHVAKMRAKFPDWTQRQVECVLYWQPTARKQLAAAIKAFLQDHPGYTVDTCPEAGGVNVTETLRRAGLVLEWPPVNIARQVAFGAIPKTGSADADQLLLLG